MKENTKQWIQFIVGWTLVIAIFMGVVGIAFSLYSVSGIPTNQLNIANIPDAHDNFKFDNKTAHHINNTNLIIITGESQRK